MAINSGLVAGGANLLNLFDLRPGRAIKVAALSACLIAAASALAGGAAATRPGAAGSRPSPRPAGAALALLPADLGEQAMLGDAGANALGALLGAAAARRCRGAPGSACSPAIAALTVASEKVSFTKVIAASPPLRLARHARPPPVPPAAPVPAGRPAACRAPPRRRSRCAGGAAGLPGAPPAPPAVTGGQAAVPGACRSRGRLRDGTGAPRDEEGTVRDCLSAARDRGRQEPERAPPRGGSGGGGRASAAPR